MADPSPTGQHQHIRKGRSQPARAVILSREAVLDSANRRRTWAQFKGLVVRVLSLRGDEVTYDVTLVAAAISFWEC